MIIGLSSLVIFLALHQRELPMFEINPRSTMSLGLYYLKILHPFVVLVKLGA